MEATIWTDTGAFGESDTCVCIVSSDEVGEYTCLPYDVIVFAADIARAC